MADIIAVLRALVDAAFKGGTITDLAHAELHGHLDAAEQPTPEPEAPAAPEPAGPVQPEPPFPPADGTLGTEEGGFGG